MGIWDIYNIDDCHMACFPRRIDGSSHPMHLREEVVKVWNLGNQKPTYLWWKELGTGVGNPPKKDRTGQHFQYKKNEYGNVLIHKNMLENQGLVYICHVIFSPNWMLLSVATLTYLCICIHTWWWIIIGCWLILISALMWTYTSGLDVPSTVGNWTRLEAKLKSEILRFPDIYIYIIANNS